MRRDYGRRYTFMALAIAVLFLSPIFLLILPSMIVHTIYFSSDTWFIFVPGSTYLIYGLGFIFLFLAPLVLFLLDIRKRSVIICLFFLLLSGVTFSVASKSYIAFADQTITYRANGWSSTSVYSWDEVDKVYYGKEDEQYEFVFHDGFTFRMGNSGKVSELRPSILRMLRYTGGEYETIDHLQSNH